MKLRRTKVMQQASRQIDDGIAARVGGHCGGKTCMASRDARRGGKQGTLYPCLCACPFCAKIRRETRGQES